MYACSLHAASFRAGDQVLGPNGKVEIVPVRFYNREATIVDLQTKSARLHVATCHVSGSEGTSSRAAVHDALLDPTAFDSLGDVRDFLSDIADLRDELRWGRPGPYRTLDPTLVHTRV